MRQISIQDQSHKGQSFVTKFFVYLFSILFVSIQGFAQGTWAPLTHVAPQYNSGVMLLLTDGTIMCKTSSGGSNGTVWDKLTPDIHGSYINGTWTTLAAMHDDRLYFSSQVLRDGRVYVAGGEYGSGGPKGETYNPLTNTWAVAPSPGMTVSDGNSEILKDGRVLQGQAGSSNKIWDPATNTYSAAPNCLRWDNEAPWLKLPDGTILFVDNYGPTSERYIQATNTWINDATVPVALFDPFGSEAGGAFMLPDGRAFFIGSTPTTAYYTPSGSTSPGTWAAGPAIPTGQGEPDAASAIMADGHILMSVSPTATSADHFPSPTAFLDFDYITNTFTPVGAPGGGTTIPESSYLTNMLVLPDGNVLFADQGDDQYYEYTPGNPQLAAGQPTVATVSKISCDTFMATGTLFNGINEGASYGDDWQMETNYPLIRLRSGSNVYYTTTYHWNSTGVMRGALPDTTQFVLPAGLPAGTYLLEVVVNGIASAPFPFDPAFVNVPASFSVCPGIPTTVTNAWAGGVWSSLDPTVATVGSSTGIVNGVAAGTTTISYTIGACAALSTVTINAAAPPITPLGGVNLCIGSSTSLGDLVSGGSWTSDLTGIAMVNALSGNLTGVSAGTTNISYTVGGCSAVEPVTINPLPAATITPTGATTFCSGGSVLLTANSGAGYTYQWQLGGAPIGGATDITYTAASGGNYAVVVANAQGCAAISGITIVTVNTAPPAVITPAGPTTFCTGGSVVLNGNAGVGLTYQWQLGGFGIPGATNISYTAAAGGNYTLVVTNASACSTTSGTTIVNVDPAPSPITGTATVCVGATTPLGDVTLGGTWSSSSSLVATVGTTGIVTGMGTGGLATISYSVGSGCVTTIVVTVNSTTAAPITGPSSVCAGQTIPLLDGTPSGTWSSSSIARATVGSSTGIVTGVSGGTATISYSVTSTCGSATATTLVNINPAPAVLPVTGIATACPGNTSILVDGTPGGVWSSSSSPIATVGTSGIVTAVSVGAAIISYTVTSIAGCVGSSAATFVVADPISATVTPSGLTSFCTGGYVILNATTGVGLRYQWQTGGVAIPGATLSAYTATASGNYTVFVSTTGGCNSTTAPIAVVVNPSPIVIPSVSISASPGFILCMATSPVTFTATGGPLPSYQWYVNGTAAAAGATYTYSPASGDIVKCVLNSGAACAFPVSVSQSATMLISPMQTPAVSISPSLTDACSGDTVRFSAIPVYGGAGPTYTWKQNGINVATGPAYIYAPSNRDILVCTMISDYPCVTTSTAVSSNFVVSTQPSLPNPVYVSVTQSDISSGNVDTFVAVAPNAGTAPLYQWLINGAPVSGATNAIYITRSLVNNEVVSCYVTSSESCVSPRTKLSSGITIKVESAGVQQLNNINGDFALQPNPNKGEFAIEGTLTGTADEQVSIVITDMLGQTIYKETVTGSSGRFNKHIVLDNAIANGMYLVSITSGAEHAVFHMVIGR